jgi:hypothetical protein
VTTARNVAIVLAIAAVITFLPGGGDFAEIASRTLAMAFIGVIVFGIAWAYRRERIDLEPLTPAFRLLLYSAIGVIALTLAAASKLTPTPEGTLLLIVLLCGAAAALYAVWREYHSLG